MKTVLIADDSKFMRNYLKRKLQQQRPLTIVEATNGREAIDIYKLTKPDMVFLDITMPTVNGLTALRKIIEFDSKAKVIMCSAMGTQSNIIEALQLGAIDFIVKPNFNNLIYVIEKLDT
ncbi:response regulator [Lentibacillus cibarius]|uniref:Response regulator n=1 Tax=Lentibacillus cibarius TaxID=2583219 RepID=A0A549YFS2_9BACI|nr:response regulator [Lentibacillus cibarius]TRM10698.1 response regulator [Lentibacillus cibarius]